MDVNYKFSHLIGSVYRNGNVVFAGDGNSIVSPVGNKISVFDLKNNTSRTLNLEASYNITAISLSRTGSHLLVANEKGEILYVNMLTESTVFRFRANRVVRCLQFSPDAKRVAIARGSDLQIHEVLPSYSNAFSPLQLKSTYKLTNEEVVSIDWSTDGRLVVTGCEDKEVRVVGSQNICNTYITVLGSHKAEIVTAQFLDGSYDLVSIDRRGMANCWTTDLVEDDIIYGKWIKPSEDDDKANDDVKPLKYKKSNKCVISDSSGEGRSIDVTAARVHGASRMLVTGFANGVFVIHEVPSFSLVHSLRASGLSLSTISISPSGDWLALGCGRGSQGQLIVWEWQSETYVMKQQSHQLTVRAAKFSPDGGLLATAGEDGKVKVWNTRSCFCIVSFDEHSSSSTDVAWTQSGKALLSSSLDGTVRARDLKRYRNFRTLVCPDPTPLGSVQVDTSGDIVVAAGVEVFQLFVWSLDNGHLLDVLSGHSSCISSISLKGNTLSSVSTDKTLRMWNIVDSSCETVDLTGEGIVVSFAPTQSLVAVLSLDASVSFLETNSLQQIGSIDVKYDLDPGRLKEDKIKKQTSERSKCFTSMSFSPDSSLLLLGGQSNHFCLYSVEDRLLVRRFTMTVNRSLDGVDLDISRRNYSEFGNMHLIDTSDSEEEMSGKKAIKLAGTKHADKGERRHRPEAELFNVAFCPTGRKFVVCATEGVQLYSLDASSSFDPFELDSTTSTEQVERLLEKEEYTRAMKGALQLGDKTLVERCVDTVPREHIPHLSRALSLAYTERLLIWLASGEGLVETTRLERYMEWMHSLVAEHGPQLKEKDDKSILTAVQQTVLHHTKLLASLTEHNINSLLYLSRARKLRNGRKKEENAMEVD